jgi:hypothetical protein
MVGQAALLLVVMDQIHLLVAVVEEDLGEITLLQKPEGLEGLEDLPVAGLLLVPDHFLERAAVVVRLMLV